MFCKNSPVLLNVVAVPRDLSRFHTKSEKNYSVLMFSFKWLHVRRLPLICRVLKVIIVSIKIGRNIALEMSGVDAFENISLSTRVAVDCAF